MRNPRHCRHHGINLGTESAFDGENGANHCDKETTKYWKKCHRKNPSLPSSRCAASPAGRHNYDSCARWALHSPSLSLSIHSASFFPFFPIAFPTFPLENGRTDAERAEKAKAEMAGGENRNYRPRGGRKQRPSRSAARWAWGRNRLKKGTQMIVQKMVPYSSEVFSFTPPCRCKTASVTPCQLMKEQIRFTLASPDGGKEIWFTKMEGRRERGRQPRLTVVS